MYYLIIALLLCIHALNAHTTNSVAAREENDFIASFINNYGFSSNAYDAREYHPFILHQTQCSFEHLESHLAQQGFNARGRILLLGYQEDAIPSYYTKQHTHHISDETSTKTDGGWQFAPGNVAGFVTGFALQNSNECPLARITHITPERVELFDPRATLFHKHAFGESYPHVIGMHTQTVRALVHSDNRLILHTLNAWWKKLYIDACRDGARNVVATQDIMFTIRYAQYLLQSTLPILHWYTGPDITYPIEVLQCQHADATQGAQMLVQQLATALTARDNKKTAYIFCSFTDGVGKSTLLGNIRNWQKHGTHFEHYERVDNSSSQRATLYQLSDDVVIADLPAQISHHTIKPDGSVYVDLRTIKDYSPEYNARICAYAHNALPTLIEHAADSTPYAHLCALLKRTDTPWIPFSYEGNEYMVHRDNPKNIKILIPFEKVHSYGLKVIEPEHMIFHDGIHMPMLYENFLDDLSAQLHGAGVQEIVFVDFISMYPRTSREIIRVNMLLQQLYALYATSFDQSMSFYHHTPHPHDYYLMLTDHKQEIMRSLTHETLLRNAWHDLLIDRPTHTTTHIPADRITPLLSERIARLSDAHAARIRTLLAAKIDGEIKEFEETWAHDKVFETIVRFDHNKLVEFSSWMHTLFTQVINDDYYRELWARDDEDARYEIHHTLDRACRDAVQLQDIIPHLRAQWYAILSNILGLSKQHDMWLVKERPTAVPPLWVEYHTTNAWRVVSKSLPEYEGTPPALPKPFFDTRNAAEKPTWGTFHEKPLCTTWHGIDTTRGLYAYSCDAQSTSGSKVSALLRNWLHQQESSMTDPYITTHELVHLLKTSDGFSKTTKTKPYVKACTKEAAQLYVRALATLDMILKDPQSSCLPRTGNEKDFKAALILHERITLPHYFGISFTSPLFENYDTVKPVI